MHGAPVAYYGGAGGAFKSRQWESAQGERFFRTRQGGRLGIGLSNWLQAKEWTGTRRWMGERVWRHYPWM